MNEGTFRHRKGRERKMVCREIEVEDEAHEYLERMAGQRCRSIEKEVQILLSLLIQDPDYLDHLERMIHRRSAEEEWNDSDHEA